MKNNASETALDIVRRHKKLQILDAPDEHNSRTPDIDAVFVDSRFACYYAVEHTSIDYLSNQRRNNVRYTKFLGDMEIKLSSLMPMRLTVYIPYNFDTYVTPKDYPRVRASIEKFLIDNFRNSVSDIGTKHSIPGVPFRLNILREYDCKPRVVFMRIPPADNVELPQRLFNQFTPKIDKLKPYKKAGYTTVLLVESKDIALVDVQGQKILNAVKIAYRSGLPVGLDQIWYVDTVGDLPDDKCFRDFTPYLTTNNRS